MPKTAVIGSLLPKTQAGLIDLLGQIEESRQQAEDIKGILREVVGPGNEASGRKFIAQISVEPEKKEPIDYRARLVTVVGEEAVAQWEGTIVRKSNFGTPSVIVKYKATGKKVKVTKTPYKGSPDASDEG